MIERATEDLIRDAVSGDRPALERLLLKYFPLLERHIETHIPAGARRYFGAEDILQEVFVQAFRDIKNVRTGNKVPFLAWLKSIADHRTSDAVKRCGRKKRGGGRRQLSESRLRPNSTLVSLIDAVCHESHLPDDSVQQREIAAAIQVAVASLPTDQREAIRSHYLLNLNVDVIAQEMRRTNGAVRGLISRGKKRLLEVMGRSSRWFSSR